MTVEVLQKFGAPDKVAASYSQPRYLIGPRLFPAYWTVLRIVLAVVMIVTAIGIGLGWGQGANPGQTPVDIIADAFAGLLGSAVGARGIERRDSDRAFRPLGKCRICGHVEIGVEVEEP